jgi:AraC-like DNA-binding protein
MSSVLLELPGPREAQGGLWYSTRASTRFRRHHHHELELNVVVAGEAHYWFSDREVRVSAPAALWIPPHVEHELLDTSDDLAMWVYSFRAGGFDGLSRASAATGPAESPIRVVSNQLSDGPRVTGMGPAALARLCARSREGLLRPGVVELNGILSDVSALTWAARVRPPTHEAPITGHPAARRLATLLREADVSQLVEPLAQSMTLSRERLSRVFTQCLGIGPVQYRNHHRVQRFIHAYGQGSDANMLRTALDVGFGSYVQFHRAFKQVVGYPPVEHLERVRNGIVDPARTGAR